MPANTLTPFFGCWFRDTSHPKLPGENLNFQLNAIIVVFLHENIPPFGTNTTRSAEHKLVGTEGKPFARGSLGLMVRDGTPISIPWFLDPWIWSWEKQQHILDTDSEPSQRVSWRTLPNSARYCYLADAVTESSKGYSISLSRELLQDDREHGKTSEFCECESTATFQLWNKFLD